MRIWSSIFSLFALTLLLSGCARTLPVYNVTDSQVVSASGVQPSQVQVKDAITQAAQEKGWLVKQIADGHIEATLHVGLPPIGGPAAMRESGAGLGSAVPVGA